MANVITTLLTVIIEPMQDIEDAFQQLLTERAVGTAVGTQLDMIGTLVGQARNGLDDDDYRRLVRARITANSSDGLVEHIIAVTRLVIDDTTATVKVERQATATVVVRIEDSPLAATVADLLMGFLRVTAAAGVRIILEYSPQPVASLFVWDTPGQGWDLGIFMDALD